MGRWLKLDLGWWESEWLVVLSAEARLCWVLFLEKTKANGSRGRLKRCSEAFLARQWLVGEEAVRQMIRAAELDGAVVVHEDEWEVANWRKYQGDETGADRQARFREARSNGSNALRNDVTLEEKRGEEKRREEKPPPKGSPQKKAAASAAPRPDAEAWERFLAAYPKRSGDLGKAKGREKFQALLKGGADPEKIVAGASRYAAFLRSQGKYGTEFVKQIPTFLNGRAWEEDFEPPAQASEDWLDGFKETG